VVVLRNVNVPSVACPGSLPVPPLVWWTRLPPNRRLCAPRDHDTVSANWNCLPVMLDCRDSPIVNGTEPPRVYVVDRSCASHKVTGDPWRKANRASLSRSPLTTVV